MRVSHLFFFLVLPLGHPHLHQPANTLLHLALHQDHIHNDGQQSTSSPDRAPCEQGQPRLPNYNAFANIAVRLPFEPRDREELYPLGRYPSRLHQRALCPS